MAYADMEDLMNITEAMVEVLVRYLTGGETKLVYHPDGNEGQDGTRIMELEFKRPWKRYDMIGTLESQVSTGETPHMDETNVWLREVCPGPTHSCSTMCVRFWHCFLKYSRLNLAFWRIHRAFLRFSCFHQYPLSDAPI